MGFSLPKLKLPGLSKSGKSKVYSVFNPIGGYMDSKEKSKQAEREYNSKMAAEAKATAASEAEIARVNKIKEDEDNLVRRNMLTAAVKQRLSGRSSSNTRLTSAY